MQKSALLRALQQEIRRHDFSCFVDQPRNVAQGGRGVVVPGCPACMKRININTTSQFLRFFADGKSFHTSPQYRPWPTLPSHPGLSASKQRRAVRPEFLPQGPTWRASAWSFNLLASEFWRAPRPVRPPISSLCAWPAFSANRGS
jgi:hypothetical protein